MQRAHIYVTPVTEREQLATNDTIRLVINAIIYSKQPLVRKSLRDLFRVIPLSATIIFSQNSFASFINELW